jgi:hypothetical protein
MGELYDCHYAISAYHRNEMTKVNMQHESRLVGYECVSNLSLQCIVSIQ